MLKGVASVHFIRHANNPARDEYQRAEMQTRTVLDTMKKLQWKEVAVKFIYKTVELAQVLAKENLITGLFFCSFSTLILLSFYTFFPCNLQFSSCYFRILFVLQLSNTLFIFFFFSHLGILLRNEICIVLSFFPLLFLSFSFCIVFGLVSRFGNTKFFLIFVCPERTNDVCIRGSRGRLNWPCFQNRCCECDYQLIITPITVLWKLIYTPSFKLKRSALGFYRYTL